MSTTLAPDSQLKDLGYQPSLNRQLPFGSLLVYGLLFFVPMAPVAVFGLVVNRSGGVPVLVFSPRVKSSLLGIDCIPAETNPSVSPMCASSKERKREIIVVSKREENSAMMGE